MAFKNVKGTTNNNTEELPPLAEPVKAKEMEAGESVTGYFIGTSKKEGVYGINYNALLQNPETGERFMVYSLGTLKYDLMDERLTRGLLTRITSNGKTTRKNNQTGQEYEIHDFTVEQDPDDSIDLSAEDNLFKSASDKKQEQREKVSKSVEEVLKPKKKTASKKKKS